MAHARRQIFTRTVALTLGLGLAAPVRAQDPAPTPPPAAAEPARDKPTPAEPEPITAPPAQPRVDLVAPPNNVSQSAGMGGRAVAADDPEAKRAKADLEGAALDNKLAEGVPERLPPLQRGGWWCVFGAFAFASVGGVFAGLAESEEDRAVRVVSMVDLETGSQLEYSGDTKAGYEEILARGRRDAALAQTFIGIGAAVLVAGLGLFVADRVKRRPARVRAGLGGLQVRF